MHSAGSRENPDVIVVGAGLAGLVAARDLAGAGRDVLVLEGRDRIGGRMYAIPVAGGAAWVDLGGQWVCDTQDRIVRLADQLGVRRYPWYREGSIVLNFKAQHGYVTEDYRPVRERPYPIAPADRDAWDEMKAIYEALAASMPEQAPWTHPEADRLDQQTLEHWVADASGNEFARWMVASLARIGGSGAFEPGDTSALHFGWTQKAAPQAENPEAFLFRDGGAGQIPAKLAATLPSHRCVIERNQTVTRIERGAGGVTVWTGSGRSFRAPRVIVAVPAPLTGPPHIEHSPPLPRERQELIKASPMGGMIKVHAIYDDAFWRRAGLAGIAHGDLPTIEFTADSSPEGGRPGILTAFIAGDRALELNRRTLAEREAAVLEDFASYLRDFGDRARHPLEFRELNWIEEPLSAGGFTTYMKLEAWTRYGEWLRKPLDERVFWAGTEVATRWPGYFDGAVRSGELAAAAVLERG